MVRPSAKSSTVPLYQNTGTPLLASPDIMDPALPINSTFLNEEGTEGARPFVQRMQRNLVASKEITGRKRSHEEFVVEDEMAAALRVRDEVFETVPGEGDMLSPVDLVGVDHTKHLVNLDSKREAKYEVIMAEQRTAEREKTLLESGEPALKKQNVERRVAPIRGQRNMRNRLVCDA